MRKHLNYTIHNIEYQMNILEISFSVVPSGEECRYILIALQTCIIFWFWYRDH